MNAVKSATVIGLCAKMVIAAQSNTKVSFSLVMSSSKMR
jgi:hypothetical protein